MARAGGRAAKVFSSSGRLTFPARAASCKRRAAGRRPSSASADSGYSLCSTDSEDQVGPRRGVSLLSGRPRYIQCV
ncbi:hypothetical protein GDO78_014852 [Eleutherodactylus coqui]|uniref:Uncharacterized protein n=1 Tax=Eleutherodactylus coqui TaxID=57060 RepID=A0A8J6EE88_ELECQ|nr:hypothetical protein GDO78_014852 [Eleutherodactylus coqui]